MLLIQEMILKIDHSVEILLYLGVSHYQKLREERRTLPKIMHFREGNLQIYLIFSEVIERRKQKIWKSSAVSDKGQLTGLKEDCKESSRDGIKQKLKGKGGK